MPYLRGELPLERSRLLKVKALETFPPSVGFKASNRFRRRVDRGLT
jgi:hypothetical protein